jgi:tRNA(Glu) U13 pseudouridine synthase TruD
LLKKDYKTALLRYYIHKSKYASKNVRKAYRECFRNWGDSVKCYGLLKGKVNELVLRPLKESINGNYLNAVKKITKEELELLIAGYQALLFNDSLKGPVNGLIKLPVVKLPEELGIKPRKGTRQAFVKPINLKIKYDQNKAIISFSLPKGAFATILLKELVKND